MRDIKAGDYKIEVMRDVESGSGYLAYIPQLDCWGDGETPEDAYKDVISVASDILEMAKEDNIPIPIPKINDLESAYSGKLSLRLPKFLHSELAKRADKEDCSINQLIQTFISMGLGMKYGQEKTITINIKGSTEKIQQQITDQNDSNENISEWFNQLNGKLDRRFFESSI